ncbi:MAG: EAL domain-containing protein [Lachnospiraceae bacterium]|nr:EAL domain-containing protein [Lachnospiraceae bacterium]
MKLLLVETVVISTDILASWACEYYQSLPGVFVSGLNILYFIFFIIRGYIFFIFTCSILRLNYVNKGVAGLLYRVPLAIALLITVSSPWTGAIFFIAEDGYHWGPFYRIIEMTFMLYIVLSIMNIFYLRGKKRLKRELYGIVSYNLLLSVGIMARILFPKYLLMDNFCVMAIITIDFVFINPEFFIEKRSRLFNLTGLRFLLREKNQLKYDTLLSFIIKHYQEDIEIYGVKQMDVGINLIGSFLRKLLPGEIIFYFNKGSFIIMTNSDVNLEEIIDRIAERFKTPWLADDVRLYLEVGFVEVSSDYLQYDTNTIFGALTNALRNADNDSADRVIHAGRDMFDAILDNNIVKSVLENAIESDSVEVFLQPIMNARTGELIGAESLCRIRDEDGKIIPPGKFISIAEETGRIYELGEQVFEKTCRFIRDKDLVNMGLEWINVNISVAQLMKKDLAKSFSEIIMKYGISPSRIHLEITEAVIADELIMKNQIEELQKQGFVFALDDYGTGYSNASRLKRFTFSNVKIDMSMVWDYCDAPDEILPMLIKAFKSSGYSVTAEGIETVQIGESMKSIGCDYLQGMYFSPPIPMDDFVDKYSRTV